MNAFDFETKSKLHKEFADKLNPIYRMKNHDYGDSFAKAIDKFGYVSALTRMDDKWNRICNLMMNMETNPKVDESIEDTLLDLANYCLMLRTEIAYRKNYERNS